MRAARRIAMAGIALAVSLAAGSVGWFFFESGRRIESKRAALVRELPAIIASEDRRARPILESDLFAEPGQIDAGPVVNHRLDWTDDSKGTLLPTACIDRLRKSGADWPKLAASDVDGCDTTWLHALREFDRWSLNPGFRAKLPPGRRTDMAFPDFLEIQMAAKVHLVHGMAAGDVEPAAQDVRHLARLLFAQRYGLSTMIGLALLAVESKAHAHAPSPWSPPPLSDEQRESVRRRVMATLFLVNGLAPEGLRDEARRSGPASMTCLLWTEQAFAQLVKDLPDDTGCWLDHARFELEHPYDSPVDEALDQLSWPARVGSRIVHQLAPARFDAMARDLMMADALPAEGQWPTLIGESMARALQRAR